MKQIKTRQDFEEVLREKQNTPFRVNILKGTRGQSKFSYLETVL